MRSAAPRTRDRERQWSDCRAGETSSSSSAKYRTYSAQLVKRGSLAIPIRADGRADGAAVAGEGGTEYVFRLAHDVWPGNDDDGRLLMMS